MALYRQPPVGYKVPFSDLLRGLGGATRARERVLALEAGLARHFGTRTAFAVSSGKAGLTAILQALHALTGRRKVIVPAYTCYSVPSAVIKAGLDVVPCDIAVDSFDYDYVRLQTLLGPDVLCVLSVHLFGIPAATRRVADLCRPLGIHVVEDAAQAMGMTSDGAFLGTIGDVGLFSLGRGKNITCGSGGIVVTGSADIGRELHRVVLTMRANTMLEDLRNLASVLAVSLFISPRLYWLPAGLPWLHLGETVFYDDFPTRRLSGVQAGLLDRWQERLDALNTVRRAHSAFYLAHIPRARNYGDGIPYLRLPVLLRDAEERHQVLETKGGAGVGLGGMYPTSVRGIRQLQGRLPSGDCPEADRVAARLVTLPTHPFVSNGARDRICDLLNPESDSSVPLQRARTLS
jgi:dTDP-4-amino-4,6-dideoxygalactose transaminase